MSASRSDYELIRYVPGLVFTIRQVREHLSIDRETLRAIMKKLAIKPYWIANRRSRRDPRLAITRTQLTAITNAWLFSEPSKSAEAFKRAETSKRRSS